MVCWKTLDVVSKLGNDCGNERKLSVDKHISQVIGHSAVWQRFTRSVSANFSGSLTLIKNDTSLRGKTHNLIIYWDNNVDIIKIIDLLISLSLKSPKHDQLRISPRQMRTWKLRRYRKLPLISPGLIQFRKGLGVGLNRNKIFTNRWAYNRGGLLVGGLITMIFRYILTPCLFLPFKH